jgi:hypothetical protein
MVTLGGKDNGLEPGNHISTLRGCSMATSIISDFKLPFTFKEIGFFWHIHIYVCSELGCKYFFQKRYFGDKLE